MWRRPRPDPDDVTYGRDGGTRRAGAAPGGRRAAAGGRGAPGGPGGAVIAWRQGAEGPPAAGGAGRWAWTRVAGTKMTQPGGRRTSRATLAWHGRRGAGGRPRGPPRVGQRARMGPVGSGRETCKAGSRGVARTGGATRPAEPRRTRRPAVVRDAYNAAGRARTNPLEHAVDALRTAKAGEHGAVVRLVVAPARARTFCRVCEVMRPACVGGGAL